MTHAAFRSWLLISALCLALGTGSARAQLPFFRPSPMKKANELIRGQEPLRINKEVEGALTSENARVLVSLTKQRAWLMAGDQIYVDTPISSGKKAGMTPTGKFNISEKDPNHRSSIFGDFVDSKGRTVRSGISLKIDSAPSGTHYVGAPMKWFMRLTDSGVGMHVGVLPGYPASHGCVRLPEEAARTIYSKVRIGTPVMIVP